MPILYLKVIRPLKAFLVESLICPSKNTSRWTLNAFYWGPLHLHRDERATLQKNLEKEIFRIIVNLPWNPGLHGPDTLWTIITDYIRTLRKDKSNEEHMKVNQNLSLLFECTLISWNYPMNWKTESEFLAKSKKVLGSSWTRRYSCRSSKSNL